LFVPDSTAKYKPTKGMLLNFDKEKGLSETVVNRRTANTVSKRKKTKGQAIIYKALRGKLNIEHHEPHKNKR